MEEELEASSKWAIGVRLLFVAFAQVIFFATSSAFELWSAQNLLGWLFFDLFCFYIFFLRYIDAAAIARYAGAFFGVCVAMCVLVLPTAMSDGTAVLIAVLLPVIGQAVWILWNRLPAVQRAKVRREADKQQAQSALAGMRTATQSQVRADTVEDAEYAAAQSGAPIDVGGLARTLDEIRDKK
jgi:hypothetical protein